MGLFTPQWDLEINGSTFLSGRHRSMIRSVEVLASIDGADELMIEAEGLDQLDGTFRFIGETILAPGNMVVVWAGYAGVPLVALQEFQITNESARYSATGVPVSIRGLSAEYRLADYTAARKWAAGTSFSDVAAEIAADHGLTVTASSLEYLPNEVAEAKSAKGVVKAQGTTDLEFLQTLAKRLEFGPPYVRYDANTRKNVLYFRTPRLDDQPSVARFVFHPPLAGVETPATIFEFAPEITLAGVPTAVQVIGWDPIAQQPIAVTMEINAEGQKTLIQTGDEVANIPTSIKSGGQLAVVILDTSKAADKTDKIESFAHFLLETTEDAESWAARWLATRSKAFLRSRATVIGYEGLWIAQAHRFEGLATTHNGLYELEECRHKLHPGPYVCDLELQIVLEESAAPVAV